MGLVIKAALGALVVLLIGVLGEPAEFGKNRTLRFSGHP